MVLQLDFLQFQPDLVISRQPSGIQVFDVLRKKNVALTPEELLRQLVVRYLLAQKNYPANRMRLEVGLRLNGMLRRSDIVVFDPEIRPWLLIECKSPKIPLTVAAFEQAARYNRHWQAPFVAITNGVATLCAAVDSQTGTLTYLSDFPDLEK